MATLPSTHEVDYLIVGAGAMGLAFADTIFDEQPEATLLIVDRRAAPGGHWTDAYPYVRLHQPAAFYGVNSTQLGGGGADLSSQAEILAYFERALQRMVASGRVSFLPLHEYLGDGTLRSLADDSIRSCSARKRVVDATYMKVEVPATHPPTFPSDPAITLMPPNGLARLKSSWERFVIIGGGKTGIDAVLFLLEAGVVPERIHWIIPNDMWMWNRARIQPSNAVNELLHQAEVVSRSSSDEEHFLALESDGGLMRLDKTIAPTKWRCATVSEHEFAALRQIDQLVRAGRVERISASEIVMTHGSMATDKRTLHVDCTANGLAPRDVVPIFGPAKITLQSVLVCQQVFSAAVLARLESMRLDDEARNAMWAVVPHPERAADMAQSLLVTFENLLRGNRRMGWWLWRSRLNVAAHAPPHRYLGAAWRARAVVPAMQAALQHRSPSPSAHAED